MKLIREHINERFSEDSDPIKDMGVGVFTKLNFNDRSKFTEFLVNALPAILRTSSIPKDILWGEGMLRDEYYDKIRAYFDQYGTTFNRIKVNKDSEVFFWPEMLRDQLYAQGFRREWE